MKSKKVYISLIIAAVFLIIIYNFSQVENRGNIKGGFEEIDYVRNENNMGIILNYYAFTIGNINEADFDKLGNTLAFSKSHAETTAFFFDKNAPYPTKINLESPHFDTSTYKAIAKYTIDKEGIRHLERQN